MGSLNGAGRQLMELYVCVHVPEFPAQARLRLRPEQSRLPLVVLEGEPPLEQVGSMNRHARVLGVTHGMTRAELDSFPQVQQIRRSLVDERATRAILDTWAADHNREFHGRVMAMRMAASGA